MIDFLTFFSIGSVKILEGTFIYRHRNEITFRSEQ